MSEGKRVRRKTNYQECEPILPKNSHNTSEWTCEVKDAMHIRIDSKEIFKLPLTFQKHNMHLECIADKSWDSITDVGDLPLSPVYKTLVDEIITVHKAKNRLYEYYIDTYVYTMFHLLNFNDYPLSINPQHELDVEISKYEELIVSIPDFIIRSKKNKILVVVEDKNLISAKFINQWRENQVMGEIFVAAHNMDIENVTEMFAVRIIGTLFTFYKATITPEYIRESLLGLPSKHFMNVLRYPDPGLGVKQPNALDLCKLEHRKIIVEYLLKIKESF